MTDLMSKALMMAWLGIYIMMLIGNHATKCGDVLLYDATVISLIILGLILWIVTYDNLHYMG